MSVFRAAVKAVLWPQGKSGKSFFKSLKQRRDEEKMNDEFLLSSGNKSPFKGIERDQDQEPTRDVQVMSLKSINQQDRNVKPILLLIPQLRENIRGQIPRV